MVVGWWLVVGGCLIQCANFQIPATREESIEKRD